jgi:mycoredoxin
MKSSPTDNHYNPRPGTIVMYAVSWCGDCRRARQFLQGRQIPHLEIDVDHDPQAAEFVKQVNGGSRSVPTIIFPDGSVLVEPSREQLEEKFAGS